MWARHRYFLPLVCEDAAADVRDEQSFRHTRFSAFGEMKVHLHLVMD
jgi:hypothetical protein